MKQVTYNNKEYVRVSEVAKKFRYTTDYVGQLCRAGKVDARRVGRVWYVTLDSVKNYRKTKYKSSSDSKDTKPTTVVSAAGNDTIQIPITRRKRKVPPVTRAKTLRIAAGVSKVSGETTHCSYSSDETAVVPVVLAKSNPKVVRAVRIEKTRAVAVPVKLSDSKGASFKAEKLPEISLSGNLSVTSFSDENLSKSTLAQDLDEVEMEDSVTESARDRQEVTQDAASEMTDEVQAEMPRKKDKSAPPKKSPQLHVTQQSAVPHTRKVGVHVSAVWVSYAAALLLALVILGLGSTAVVGSGEYTNHVIFDIKNFQNLAQLFP